MNIYFTHQKLKYLIIAVIALFLAVFPVCVLADTTIITNSVKASASSGGNTASGNGGQIVIGETEVDIFVETVINGETVEYIDEHYEGSDIPDDGIHKETHYESEDKSVVVDTDITVNADAEETYSAESSAGSEDQGVAKEDILNQASLETAAAINSVAKVEDQPEKEEDSVKEKAQINNAGAKTEKEKETKNTGIFSLITNFFKYVLSIFA